MTVHLVDRATGFSRVYSTGVGRINHEMGAKTEGESLSLYPVLSTRGHAFSVDTTKVNPCRIWWHDRDTGKTLPVFAGMPFLSFYGPYGMHGPITDYWRKNGGRLKRGYVSHGCVRMEAADIVELWAYIKGVPRVSVWLQKEIERDEAGRAIDIDARWIGSECMTDTDCNYEGGTCRPNRFNNRGTCSAPCDRYCPDRFGYPTTFCVPADADDPQATVGPATKGFCAMVASDQTHACQRYSGLTSYAGVARNHQSSVIHNVCLAGTRGWIGAPCSADNECQAELQCQRMPGAAADAVGECTQACTKYCPDLLGHAGTFCVEGSCRRRCLLNTNDAGCAPGATCQDAFRFNAPWVHTAVCTAGD